MKQSVVVSNLIPIQSNASAVLRWFEALSDEEYVRYRSGELRIPAEMYQKPMVILESAARLAEKSCMFSESYLG
jgi:hypothetical protein